MNKIKKIGLVYIIAIAIVFGIYFRSFPNEPIDSVLDSKTVIENKNNNETYKITHISDIKNEIKQLKKQLLKQRNILYKQKTLLMNLYDKYDSNITANDTIEDEFLEEQSGDEIADVEDQIQILNNQINDEPIDQQWSVKAADAINRTLEEEILQSSSLVGLSCRSTLCRLQIEHNTVEDVGVFMDNFTHLLRWNTRVRIKETENSDGTVDTLMFIAREGFLFPSHDNRKI